MRSILKCTLIVLASFAGPALAQQAATSAPPAAASASSPQVSRSLAELQERIRTRLSRPEVRRGRIGIKVVSLNSGKVVFENDADKYFMPASNMKNFTVATAIEKLTPDFRFVTSVYAPSPVDSSGTIKGDLRIYGRGDISISNAFLPAAPATAIRPWTPEYYYFGIDKLVEKILQAGVKRVEGSLVGDESYFAGDPLPGTWEWDDLQSYYGTEVSSLPINDNAIDVSVAPSTVKGGACIVKVMPVSTVVRIVNRCTTAANGASPMRITKLLNQNVIEISGSVAPGSEESRTSVAVTRPAQLFIEMLRQRLIERGVKISGASRVENPPRLQPELAAAARPALVEIARLESPPFKEIAAKTMKPSQNMYTETILRTLGEQIGRAAAPGSNADSERLGLGVVKDFLTSIGIPADGIVQYDGSGLSRHDLITPEAVVTLYTYMAKQSRFAQAWRDSLTIAGVDGTLRNRFKGTAAQGNFRGKTGTIDQVSALSGYMTTAGGEQLVVSIVVNGVPTPRERTSLIDDIVVALTNFEGKID
ncbi:MAG: D-alanyl-D-alanine carboxypeptidase/D-alanyl-D-alanine-endopeptidase [Pyrinomonadaceae bacterium]